MAIENNLLNFVSFRVEMLRFPEAFRFKAVDRCDRTPQSSEKRTILALAMNTSSIELEFN